MDYGHIDDWRALAPALAQAIGVAPPAAPPDHPALAWRRAGLMEVTGRADGAGLVCPAALTAFADAGIAMLRAFGGSAALPANGAVLLGERARLLGLRRRGAVSANGSCRLLDTADGRIALNLPRVDDWDLASAMVGEFVGDWQRLAAIVRSRGRDALIERGRLLGLAIAPDRQPAPTPPFAVTRLGAPVAKRGAPLVVDLSALWAGPLAGSLLAAAGARVVKVESARRPDGGRAGDPGFSALLNGMKDHVTLDFDDPVHLAELRALIASADIVIEASRPRALAQLGIDARAEAARGATWLSITAHGRDGAAGEAIGFGDDAAVAGGLSAAMERAWGEPLFAGDAIADPLTGIVAALAGWAGWRAGGGRLVSIAMADVVAFACRYGAANRAEALAWQAIAEADDAPLYPARHIAPAVMPPGI